MVGSRDVLSNEKVRTIKTSKITIETMALWTLKNHWFILFYHVWISAWIEIHWNSIWLRAQLHDITLHFSVLCPSVDCLFKCAAHNNDIVGSSPNKPIRYSIGLKEWTLNLNNLQGCGLCDFGGVLGWPLDTFYWALTISWLRLLACVWSGP